MPQIDPRAVEKLRGRKRDYQLCFGGPGARAVLVDLARFCRANATCFDPDARVHAVLEGRREVFLRIAHHLNFNPEELAVIYRAATFGDDNG